MIEVIGVYIEKLYEREINYYNIKVVCVDDEFDFVDAVHFNSWDTVGFKKYNRDLAEQLFYYVCSVLEKNEKIILDIDALKRLLNRKLQPFYLSVEKDYIGRSFDFRRLAIIIKKNGMLEKANLKVEDIYQLLIDTDQIDNEEVFVSLVGAEQYSQSHNKIDEMLTWCNAKTFIAITRIIRRNYDKDFDRFSIAKKRNKNKFCELLILELLHGPCEKEDYDLIYQILDDSEIIIDYDMYYSDYTGQSDLKSMLALSENRAVIRKLIENTEPRVCYSHETYGINLYTLYAIAGEYEKAMTTFEEGYNFEYDLDDEDGNWDAFGYAYGGWGYSDSLAKFIRKMCESFTEDNTDYAIVKKSIDRILNCKNVRCVNLEETLESIGDVLTPEDLEFLVDALLKKYKQGEICFLSICEYESMFTQYKISKASKEEVEKQLSELSKKGKIKILVSL